MDREEPEAVVEVVQDGNGVAHPPLRRRDVFFAVRFRRFDIAADREAKDVAVRQCVRETEARTELVEVERSRDVLPVRRAGRNARRVAELRLGRGEETV